MKIFGYEPTLVLQTVAGLLAVLVAFGFPGLSANQAAMIIAALTAGLGAVNALMVRPIPPVAFTSLVGALAALLAAYGLELSQEMVGSVSVAVLSVLALLTRGQVSPTTERDRISA